MVTDLHINEQILRLIILILLGIAAFLLSIFLLRKLARKFMTPEQYKQLKKQRATLVIVIIIGLAIALGVASGYTKFSSTELMPIWESMSSWGMQYLFPALLIALAAIILARITKLVVPPAMQKAVKVRCDDINTDVEINKRAGVLSKFITRIAEVILYSIAGFMILAKFGIDIGPVLAGAGIVGIAVGFGSQKVIGDLLNGAFIMLEDYYSVGDVVRVAGISGLVEEVDIRRTVLRDLDGVVHIIPNSEIKTASNFTRTWSRVNINIPVSYNEDIDKVMAILNKVGEDMAQDENFKDMIITPPKVLRIDNFGDSAIEIKMLSDTKPLKQWDVAGELRKRVKKAFDEENIEIPWPHTKVYFGNSIPDRQGKSV